MPFIESLRIPLLMFRCTLSLSIRYYTTVKVQPYTGVDHADSISIVKGRGDLSSWVPGKITALMLVPCRVQWAGNISDVVNHLSRSYHTCRAAVCPRSTAC